MGTEESSEESKQGAFPSLGLTWTPQTDRPSGFYLTELILGVCSPTGFSQRPHPRDRDFFSPASAENEPPGPYPLFFESFWVDLNLLKRQSDAIIVDKGSGAIRSLDDLSGTLGPQKLESLKAVVFFMRDAQDTQASLEPRTSCPWPQEFSSPCDFVAVTVPIWQVG